MRPLPRLLAFTTDAICRAADFGVRAAAIASIGPAAALVVRAPASTAAQHAAFAERVTALVQPPEAAAIIHGRPDLAAALGAQGVHLRRSDLPLMEARQILGRGWIGVSVHHREAAEAAIAEGADYLVAGNLFESASHPGLEGRGIEWLESLTALGVPVLAIGGITPERAPAVRTAGAWGVAAIGALWEAADPARAAEGMMSPWL